MLFRKQLTHHNRWAKKYMGNCWTSRKNEDGFTLTELTVVIVLTGIATVVLYTIFHTSFTNFLSLQNDSNQYNTLAQQNQRVATVVRGLTDIIVANSNELSLYAYFSPNDSYVSVIRYYVAGNNPSLLADITPMTANPPSGVPITNQKRTYTVIENYSNVGGTPLFEYLDSTGSVLTMPVTNQQNIKGIRINITQRFSGSSLTDNYSSSLTVSLRNRKTNL